MDKTNTNRAKVSTGGPTTGILSNAALVRAGASKPYCQTPVFTRTSPVMAQTTTVSQNVPVEDTRACLTGFLVRAAAATMAAEPSPDSFENMPLLTPCRTVVMIAAPMKPPAAACPVNADFTIKTIVPGIPEAPMMRITAQPSM